MNLLKKDIIFSDVSKLKGGEKVSGQKKAAALVCRCCS